MLIGITGRQGCGKSTYTKWLANRIPNSIIVDVDKISKALLEVDQNIQYGLILFGSACLLPNMRALNTQYILSKISEDGGLLIKWNNHFKNQVRDTINIIIKSNPDATIIVDSALLPELHLWVQYDLKILLHLEEHLRKERLIHGPRGLVHGTFEMREKIALRYNPKEYDMIINTARLENITI